jgi:23S rRNA pseudouridine2605 synthase
MAPEPPDDGQEPRTHATPGSASVGGAGRAEGGSPQRDEQATSDKLQKVLARAGVASRRAVELLILEGRVRVNGEVATIGQRVDPRQDVLEVDGALVAANPDLVHYLVHKPAGVVTTASDPRGRPTVIDLVPAEPRVFPVGRLDADTEGLLLLTNDGELTHRITHPRHGVEKEYLAEVEGQPSRGALRHLREGVDLEDGRTAPAKASLLAPSVLRLVIHEGRNRQVRRMCDAVGHPVVRLVRTRIGPVTDTTLKPGEWRPLTPDEVAALARAAAGDPDQSPG